MGLRPNGDGEQGFGFDLGFGFGFGFGVAQKGGAKRKTGFSLRSVGASSEGRRRGRNDLWRCVCV